MPTKPGGACILRERKNVSQPTIAAAVGLCPSIVLQKIHYLMRAFGRMREGEYFIRPNMKMLSEDIGISQFEVRRALNKLIRCGVVVAKNLNSNTFDRRLWYRLDYDKLQVLIRPILQIRKMHLTESLNPFDDSAKWADTGRGRELVEASEENRPAARAAEPSPLKHRGSEAEKTEQPEEGSPNLYHDLLPEAIRTGLRLMREKELLAAAASEAPPGAASTEPLKDSGKSGVGVAPPQEIVPPGRS